MATTAKKRRPRATKKKAKPLSHAELVESIRGKYRFVGISSEEFAAEKQREIERDDRCR